MKWTQEELEQLYQQVNAKAAADEAFRKEIMEKPRQTLEAFAGRPLPDDFNLKMIESDSGYSATYIVPDFVQGELDVRKLSADKMEQVTGGVSFALIVSVCGLAAAVGPCGADACGGNACAAAACAANACGGDACAANACAANAGGAGGCGGNACGGDACGGNAGCGGYASGADACGANTGCAGYANHTSVCGAQVGCAGNVVLGDSYCGAYYGCAGYAG